MLSAKLPERVKAGSDAAGVLVACVDPRYGLAHEAIDHCECVPLAEVTGAELATLVEPQGVDVAVGLQAKDEVAPACDLDDA